MEEILEQNEFIGFKVLILGPYSPMLNLIENAWSVLKSHVKKAIATNMESILSHNLHNSIRENSLITLENIIEKEMSVITPTLCTLIISKNQSMLSGPLKMEDLVL